MKEEKKTIEQWYNLLPIEYRQKAIKNTRKANLREKTDSLINALSSGFAWIHTLEGQEYWLDLTRKIERNEIVLNQFKFKIF